MNQRLKQIFLGSTVVGFAGLNALSSATGTFAFQGLYAGNGNAFTSISSNFGPTNSGSAFTVSHDFTGRDKLGRTQTMNISGSAWSNTDGTKIHLFGQGTITNTYYNSSNTPYFDGTLDPDGSPDLLAINGNAGFNDELTYVGLAGSGYKANFYYYLDGTVSGDTEAGLNFYTNQSGETFNPRVYHSGSQEFNAITWVTPYFDIQPGNTMIINSDFYAGFNTRVSNYADGTTYSGTADYGHTLELVGMTVVDSNNNLVSGWSVSSASGTVYPTGAVPEPATMSVIGMGMVVLLRRRKK
jgi:hypothetical protein